MSEALACYVCGGLRCGLHRRVNGYDVLMCPECGLKWVADDGHVPEELYTRKYYEDVSDFGYKDYVLMEQNHRENAKRLIGVIEGLVALRGARILDIGCACGFYMDEFRLRFGSEVYGVELSAYAYEHSRKLNLNVLNKRFSAGDFEPEFFDLILLIGTIEHLSDPREILRDIYKALKPEGLLAITTIDTRGLIPLYALKPPEHLFYFNHDNIRILLESCGLRTIMARQHVFMFMLYDLVYRFQVFGAPRLFAGLSGWIKRFLPGTRLTIPTNEMLVIARKG